MPNKLTSLTGFGEGDPKPERKAKSSALNKKMGKEGMSSKSSRASDRTAIMRAHGVKTDAERASEKSALAKRKSDRGMFY